MYAEMTAIAKVDKNRITQKNVESIINVFSINKPEQCNARAYTSCCLDMVCYLAALDIVVNYIRAFLF